MSVVLGSFPVSAGARTGVAPLVTTCFGPRGVAAGFNGEDLADDEPVAEHADRGRVLLHDRDRSPGGCGCRRPRGAERRRAAGGLAPRATPGTAPPPVRTPPRVLAFAIPPAKDSSNLPTAAGPASTIACGRTTPLPPPVHDRRLRSRRHRGRVAIPRPLLPHRLYEGTSASNRSIRSRARRPARRAAPRPPSPDSHLDLIPRHGHSPRAGPPASRRGSPSGASPGFRSAAT